LGLIKQFEIDKFQTNSRGIPGPIPYDPKMTMLGVDWESQNPRQIPKLLDDSVVSQRG
jgi:hypothetical protein